MQYVRGVDEYRSAPAWPVPDLAAQRWYLQGDGTLDGATPPEAGPGRDYLQLPVTGVCTRSTNQWLIGALSGSPCETRSEEHTSEIQSLMRNSYAAFFLKK